MKTLLFKFGFFHKGKYKLHVLAIPDFGKTPQEKIMKVISREIEEQLKQYGADL